MHAYTRYLILLTEKELFNMLTEYKISHFLATQTKSKFAQGYSSNVFPSPISFRN
jgi:hypothetical protein